MLRNVPIVLLDADPERESRPFYEDELISLAKDMDANGLTEPIVVQPHGSRFVILDGERRVSAARTLGWQTISANVHLATPEERRDDAVG